MNYYHYLPSYRGCGDNHYYNSPAMDDTHHLNTPHYQSPPFNSTTVALSPQDYQQYLSPVLPPKRRSSYLAKVYPTPHDTVTVPMAKEYQDVVAEIDQIHRMNPPLSERDQMLYDIQLLTTNVINYDLFLDVFPTNQEALKQFNQNNEQLKQLTNEFEKKFGPISLRSEVLKQYPWQWLRGPWPWEGGGQ
ncbi:MAG: spore coat protein CotJB [Bacilli bacterium]|jgi:spore coat protein JB